MDTMLLRIFQEQVAYSCRAVLLGLDDIQSDGAPNTGRLWYGVQNFVIGAGNVSKALWGDNSGKPAERARRYAARQPLRDSLGVADTSPLKMVTIRNAFEHLDERIDRWWNESPDHNYVGILIGPRTMVNGLHEKDTLRWLDPTTGDIIFWGTELNISSVAAEVTRILPIAESERNKPHWDDCP